VPFWIASFIDELELSFQMPEQIQLQHLGWGECLGHGYWGIFV